MGQGLKTLSRREKRLIWRIDLHFLPTLLRNALLRRLLHEISEESLAVVPWHYNRGESHFSVRLEPTAENLAAF